jgi:hypothetical protein
MCKVYIINNLKTNLLIRINIIGPYRIQLDIRKTLTTVKEY